MGENSRHGHGVFVVGEIEKVRASLQGWRHENRTPVNGRIFWERFKPEKHAKRVSCGSEQRRDLNEVLVPFAAWARHVTTSTKH